MSHSCGACNLCCKVLGVPDIQKPRNMVCWWTTVHGGCSRHGEKKTAPELEACDTFKCLWLHTQENPDPELRQPMILRPDRTHVMMGPRDPENEALIYVHVDPKHPNAWKHPNVQFYINDFLARGATIKITIGEISVTLPEAAQV